MKTISNVIILSALIAALTSCSAFVVKPTETSTPAATLNPTTTSTSTVTPMAQRSAIGIVFPDWDTVEPLLLQNMLQVAGYDVKKLSSPDDQTEQGNIEALISQKVKVIIISPRQSYSASTAAAVNEAHAAGVTVINYSRLICNTKNVDYHVDADGKAVGKIWSNYFIQQAGDSKNNNLYLYAGNITDEGSFIFLEGAWETIQSKIADGTFVIKNSVLAESLAGNPVLTHDELSKIIAEVNTQWDPEVAAALAKQDLAAAKPPEKETAYIMAPNDDTGRAIADVFRADPSVKKYYLVGQDAVPGSIQYIIDGKQSLTVFKDYRISLSEAAIAAVDIMEGRTPKTNGSNNNGVKDVPAIQIGVVAITKDNIQSALIDSGIYQPDEFTGLP